MFVNISEYVEEYDYAFEEIKPHVPTRLATLESNFENCFPELTFSNMNGCEIHLQSQ
jgi:hypothetical protein